MALPWPDEDRVGKLCLSSSVSSYSASCFEPDSFLMGTRLNDISDTFHPEPFLSTIQFTDTQTRLTGNYSVIPLAQAASYKSVNLQC